MKQLNAVRWFVGMTGVVLVCGASAADDLSTYPTRSIRLVVPYPPGGGSDLVGRQVAQKLSIGLNQSVVVDNRAGAAGNVGAELVAKSAPDGYTLLLGGSSTLAVSPSLYSKLPFDSVHDFAHITLLVIVPNVLVVHPSLPVSSVRDLIKLAKAQPKALNFASQGNGSVGHLSGAMLNIMADINMAHVPYKGASPAMTSVISGETQVLFDSTFSALPYVRSKKVRALGISSLKRLSIAPEIPTISESGLPGFEAGIWYSLLAPARTPRAIVDRIYKESVNAFNLPDMRDSFINQGAQIVLSKPEEFLAYLQKDIERWAKVVKAAGVHVD